jgi:hypothetical protein
MTKRVFLVQAWAFCWLWLVVAGVERVWADLVEVAETGDGVLFTEGGREVLVASIPATTICIRFGIWGGTSSLRTHRRITCIRGASTGRGIRSG